ncbi:epididymal-specific lipocalin-12 isoform X2 [Sciurus carolinensis]|uniref:epididymal-specific lipocalin-12 isoform X2 n=1 Tax=Sciurus carolinensis TaxID=30640 RepID=UPI001FB4EC35|nr:epididymal-specific lipocalin-12 isoform X2 [Sciurus carolinensis]
MSVQSSLLDPFWAGPWQRESPCCAGPFGSPGCLPSLSRGPTHALLAAGQLAVPPTPCWQRSLWGPGGWPSSVGPCCLPRTGHSVVGGVIRAGLAGSSDPPFVGHLKGGWEQRGIQNQAQQAFHALLPGTQGPQAGAGSAEGPTCLPCFPQDCPPHPPLLPHPLGRGTRQFQGQWFVLGLASNTYRREDRALLNSFSTTYQLNKKGHFEVSNAMTRGKRCDTWSYVLTPAAQPGHFTVDTKGEADVGGRRALARGLDACAPQSLARSAKTSRWWTATTPPLPCCCPSDGRAARPSSGSACWKLEPTPGDAETLRLPGAGSGPDEGQHRLPGCAG